MPVIFSLFVCLLLALAPVPALAADGCIDLAQKAAELERRAVKSGDSNDAALLGYLYHLIATDAAFREKWDKKRDKKLGIYQDAGKKDAEHAVKWWRRAVDKGNASARYWLALAYMYSEGVKEDIEEYVRLMRLTADQGLSGAQYKLGEYYIHHKPDPAQAKEWYMKSAAQGFKKAAGKLPYFYDGTLGPEELKEKLFWHGIGRKISGTDHKTRATLELETQITKAERAEIDARVAAWEPKPSPATLASRKLNAPMEEMERWIERKCPPAPPPNPKKKKGPA